MVVPAVDSAPSEAALDAEILRIVLYYDVFRWPLSRGEIARFVAPEQPDAVSEACDALIADGRLHGRGPLVFVAGREAEIARRTEASRRAERLWPAARRAAALLARFPFVRGVLVTGGLSKGSVGDDSDVDFLLVVEPGRVWVTKTLLQAWRRALPTPVRECFCTNYLIAEDRLEIDDRSAYIAVELATAVPMYGDACARLLEANPWASTYVRGWDWAVRRARNAPELPERRLARGIEAFAARGGDDLDRRALGAWDRYWNRKYGWLDADTRAQRFKRRPDVATNHLNDFQFWVLDEWRERLRRHGVDEPGR